LGQNQAQRIQIIKPDTGAILSSCNSFPSRDRAGNGIVDTANAASMALAFKQRSNAIFRGLKMYRSITFRLAERSQIDYLVNEQSP
jgi:hypothetical protein